MGTRGTWAHGTQSHPQLQMHSRAPKVMTCNSLPLGLSRAEGVRAQHQHSWSVEHLTWVETPYKLRWGSA